MRPWKKTQLKREDVREIVNEAMEENGKRSTRGSSPWKTRSGNLRKKEQKNKPGRLPLWDGGEMEIKKNASYF